MGKFNYLFKLSFGRLICFYLYKIYVSNNEIVNEDILQNAKVRGVRTINKSLFIIFCHLFVNYPDFAYVFLYRIRNSFFLWRFLYTESKVNIKIFGSTKIKGGMVCYHPYASILNAKSIGSNFVFRNCLTIGNKNDDNSLIPVIGDNVEVGSNVVIIGNITIGNNVVIGAGSVVVKNVPDNVVIAGNPAKVIRNLN